MAGPRLLWARAPDVPDDWPVPVYATDGAAGIDLPAYLPRSVWLHPGERVLVRTGWHVAIPEGYEGQVRPRSGLALRHGITIGNSPGTVDCDFRGELMVLLVYPDLHVRENPHALTSGLVPRQPLGLALGVRIAQLVIAPVAQAEGAVVSALPETSRGTAGWGSTGR